MKKLLLAGLLLFSISLAAQKRLAFSILTGPGWMQPFSGLKDGSAVRSQIGWTAACEVSFEIAGRWDFKTTLQYHQAKLVAAQGNPLPAINLESSAWHYSFGTRWYCTPPGIWQWYADVGLGNPALQSGKTSVEGIPIFHRWTGVWPAMVTAGKAVWPIYAAHAALCNLLPRPEINLQSGYCPSICRNWPASRPV